MPATPVESIIEALAGAWRTGTPYRADFAHPPSESQAYAIQDGVAAALRWFADGRAHAWKAGGRDVLTAAPLPRVLSSGATWSRVGEGIIVMEAEVSLRLARTPVTPGDVDSCIGHMCASIEIVGTRLCDGINAPAPWKLADQQLHACSIAGADIPYAARDWRRQRGRLVVNGVARDFEGTHPNGDPVFPLSWLARHAQGRGTPLQAGDLVMTGAWLIAEAKPGDLVEAHFDGIGTCSVRVAA